MERSGSRSARQILMPSLSLSRITSHSGRLTIPITTSTSSSLISPTARVSFPSSSPSLDPSGSLPCSTGGAKQHNTLALRKEKTRPPHVRGTCTCSSSSTTSVTFSCSTMARSCAPHTSMYDWFPPPCQGPGIMVARCEIRSKIHPIGGTSVAAHAAFTRFLRLRASCSSAESEGGLPLPGCPTSCPAGCLPWEGLGLAARLGVRLGARLGARLAGPERS
mmetsp:Transcript_58850/g.134657  ORF Transcript_58850/g.134657 Transcript_58850/m.134657 type:complete len:220 (-) Transcript_58850:112-771(-)